MLSYQHAYHAGNLADVQKHAILAWVLNYLTQKDKPLSYIESHAGRGLYDLTGPEALKTGEAARGITALRNRFSADHPYSKALKNIDNSHPGHYPGSPLIAAQFLRDTDQMHLAELHPQEVTALRAVQMGRQRKIYQQDGMQLAQSLCPPDPRRGMFLIDPSWEVKTDYVNISNQIDAIHKKWNVGIIALWYPILSDDVHLPMLRTLQQNHPDALRHEVRFPPVRDGHRMVGSGMFVINPPWGLADEAKRLSALFTAR